MDWLKEITEEEIRQSLTNDVSLIYESCGLEVLVSLWTHLAGISIYPSTKPLNDLRRLYIRRKYNGSNKKELATTLGVSEQFVYEALTTTDKKDERQGKLL